eukprot:CAMPEP_0202825556 /NCGR_PEP_ID=MMETSP1389-20130828/13106_1 /ASSEMBLY_ACC=CAM_ASM_000865 /TAXON_ID=302021 /ORGANISM="Rhodomonas sp., Strain CCMP768" /LENGTH=246 /DNA_ID=CAMNT_0049498797 /DNA_START=93 /DNA_END=831 /DNA_ORIENTATION=-
MAGGHQGGQVQVVAMVELNVQGKQSSFRLPVRLLAPLRPPRVLSLRKMPTRHALHGSECHLLSGPGQREELTSHSPATSVAARRAVATVGPEAEEGHDGCAEGEEEEHLPAQAEVLAPVHIRAAEVLCDKVHDGDVEEDPAAQRVQRPLQPHFERVLAVEVLEEREGGAAGDSEGECADEEGDDGCGLGACHVLPDGSNACAEAEAFEELVEGEGDDEPDHGAAVFRHDAEVHPDHHRVHHDAQLQ